MTTKRTIGLAIVSLVLAGAACRNEPEDVPLDSPEENAEKTGVDSDRNQHIADLEQRLSNVDAKLDKLEDDMSEDMSETKKKAVKDLRDEREALSTKLAEAKTASSDEYEDIKRDLDRGMDDLERGYNDLLDSMKTER